MKYFLTVSIILISCSCFGQSHTLEFFIGQARDNSPLIKDFNNQILSNRLDSLILRASLKTQVNFISSNSYAPVVKGFGYDGAITNGANISAVVQANRNFLTQNNVATQLAAIRLQSQSLSDTIHISEQDIKRAVTDQYITAYSDLVIMDFNQEIYNLLKKEEEVLKKLTQSSVYKQADYLAFYTTLQQQQFLYLQAQIQYNTDYLTLNYLAGIVDTTVERIQSPALNDSTQFDFYHSVFYQRFATDSMRLANEKAIINYEYKPRIGAYTDAGYISTLTANPYRNFGFSFGLSLTVPIYDAHQRKYRLSQVDLRERTRVNNKLFFLNQYKQQIAQLNQQLHASDLLVKTINEQIKYVKTLISANAKLLETGDIKISDYVLAITNYINARNILNQNYINRLRIVNQINYWNR
ncbi:TolC family protein [Segetibacter koreensis]|uniref:TolC family protein n=1 Tax=Segetibacter koreensis TaxID=398037 RepID=UPI00035F23E6|nr:TolC family protein [Segetibacter koreensis]